MLGGEIDTIDFTLKELKKKNPVPVIIVHGSGGAADVLACAIRLVTSSHFVIYICIDVYVYIYIYNIDR